MSAWLDSRIVARRDWAPGLASLVLDGELAPFEAGQWTNVALNLDGERVQRAYSLASAPGAPPELFVASVPGGRFSPRLAALAVGDALQLQRQPQGFFSLRWLPPAKDLWLVATGTGLAPYVSMLRAGAVLERFERVVVVHGARTVAELAYRDELRALGAVRHVAAVTRQAGAEDVEHGRVTTLLQSGQLERAAGFELDPARSHLMLCGNPAMIDDVSALLERRGLIRHRQRKPGHVTVERYWELTR
jgi:ferredoxin--NADP+ reductase